MLRDAGVSVLWPRKVSGAEPQLPPELAGKAGSVYLTVTIGADGKVQDVKVLGGDEQFVSPVVAALSDKVGGVDPHCKASVCSAPPIRSSATRGAVK